MACPLRIAVVAGSALIAFLAFYLTFWRSEPDELDQDVMNEELDDEDTEKSGGRSNKKVSFWEKLRTSSPKEILLEGALFHRNFSTKNLLLIGAVHVVVLSVAYYAYDYTAFLDNQSVVDEAAAVNTPPSDSAIPGN